MNTQHKYSTSDYALRNSTTQSMLQSHTARIVWLLCASTGRLRSLCMLQYLYQSLPYVASSATAVPQRVAIGLSDWPTGDVS